MASAGVSLPPNHYLVRYEKDKNAASVIPGIDIGGCFDDIACDVLLQCPEDNGRADHHPRHFTCIPHGYHTALYPSLPGRYGEGEHGTGHHAATGLRPYRYRKGGNPAGAMANGVCHRYHRCLPPPRRFAAGDERPADGEAADRMALLSREMVVRRPLVDGCGSRGAEVFTKKQPSFK